MIGAELLEASETLRHLAPFVRHHHERWGGRGYPDGLAGEVIPLEAPILDICAAVEAMASDRPYHQAMPLADIIAEVQCCAGHQFDPAVAAACVRMLEQRGRTMIINSALEVLERQKPARAATLETIRTPATAGK
ncbi:MAG TPA: HD domain-containing phosphohydrolase [Roseiflexaceae bacterium]|nr:HD domain-containing phosphohydrolase [Roseiflexaceae bacterium]